MKRATYKEAIKWIADNDETACVNFDTVCTSVTVLLIADLFDVATEIVAQEILNCRSDDWCEDYVRNANRVDGFDRDDHGEPSPYHSDDFGDGEGEDRL